MQSRTRRAHGIGTKKISVSVSEADLAVLTARARRLHRGNMSAVVGEMVATLRREEALDELLTTLGGPTLDENALQKLRDEIAAAPTKARRRRTAA